MTCSSTSTVEELSDLTLDDFGEDPFSSVMIDAPNNQLIKSKETYSTADIGHELSVGSHFIERHGTKRKAPPIGYICHICKTPGHYIHHCHTNSDRNYDKKRHKRPTGTAVAQPDHVTFLKEMAKVPTMIPKQSTSDIPLGLRCPLCSEIMKKASIAIKCCMKSFCDKFIRDHMINKSMCACGSRNMLADDLVPNKTIQKIIEDFSCQSHRTTGSSSSTMSFLSESSTPKSGLGGL